MFLKGHGLPSVHSISTNQYTAPAPGMDVDFEEANGAQEEAPFEVPPEEDGPLDDDEAANDPKYYIYTIFLLYLYCIYTILYHIIIPTGYDLALH